MFTKELQSQWDVTYENSLLPEEVAGAMLEMVESSQYPGGSVVHFEKGTGMKIIPEPYALQLGLEKSVQFTAKNFQPIRTLLDKERRTLL